MFRVNSSNVIKLITATIICISIFAIFVFQWGATEAIHHFLAQTPQCSPSEVESGCSTFSEHVSSLISFLIAITQRANGKVFVFFLFPLFMAISLNIIFVKIVAWINSNLRYNHFFRYNRTRNIFNYLITAFARGILKPKIYR